MTIEASANQDLPIEDEIAVSVTGGRRKLGEAKHTSARLMTAAVLQPSTVAATSAPVANTPLPISPFGDDCIPAEDATGAGTSS